MPMLISTEAKILTGAQIPLSQLRNDAVDNLLGALSIAGLYIIPGTAWLIERRWRHLVHLHQNAVCFSTIAFTEVIVSRRYLPLT